MEQSKCVSSLCFDLPRMHFITFKNSVKRNKPNALWNENSINMKCNLFRLQCILSFIWMESPVYIYYRYAPWEDDGRINTTVILPRFILKCSLVRNSNSFKKLAPKAFRAPFSRKYRPPRKPSSRENFPLPCN